MAREYSAYQQKIIRNYYRNLDQIRAQRLAELVTEIWLAKGERQRERLWERAAKLLGKREEQPAEVLAILDARDAEGLARLAGRE